MDRPLPKAINSILIGLKPINLSATSYPGSPVWSAALNALLGLFQRAVMQSDVITTKVWWNKESWPGGSVLGSGADVPGWDRVSPPAGQRDSLVLHSSDCVGWEPTHMSQHPGELSRQSHMKCILQFIFLSYTRIFGSILLCDERLLKEFSHISKRCQVLALWCRRSHPENG